jgi:hypothetical protein
MSKKCDRCGALASDAETFCAECGAELPSTETQSPIPEKKRLGKRADRLQKQREVNIFSLNMLLSSFVDGEVFYSTKSVWSELLVAAFPIAAYAFFFLHIGLDKFFLSYIGGGRVLLFFLLGIAYGLATVLFKAGVVFGADMLETKGKATVNFFGCVRSIGLSHCIPAIVAFLGILFRLVFSWSSLTFGLVSLLLNLYPYYTLLESKLKNKYLVLAAVTLVGFIQCIFVAPLLFAKFI